MSMNVTPRLCMKCGWICSYMDINEPILICEFCNNELVEAPITARIYFNDYKFSERLKLEKQWLEEIIKSNPEFDQELHNKEVQWNRDKMNSNYSTHSPSPPQVKCPKCGSEQIQAVMRKWSLLTGFLTNKVDRVCLNCKNKW